MLLTESQLRNIICEAILLEDVEKKLAKIDAKTDAVIDKSSGLLDKSLAKLDDLLAKEEEGQVGDESLTVAGVLLGSAGLALGLPTILKVISKIAGVIGATITAAEDFATFGKGDSTRMDRYEEWWSTRSEELHHKYKDWMNIASEKLLSFVMDEEPTEKQIKILSSCLWGVLYFTIGVHAGMGAWHAFHSTSTLTKVYGGYEAIAAAVKEGEALGYLVDVIQMIAGI